MSILPGNRSKGQVRTSRVARSMRLEAASAAAIESLEMRLLMTVSWSSASSGDWNVATNWDALRVPGVNDAVVINVPNVKVTVSNNQAAASIDLAGSNTLEVAGGQ